MSSNSMSAIDRQLAGFRFHPIFKRLSISTTILVYLHTQKKKTQQNALITKKKNIILLLIHF